MSSAYNFNGTETIEKDYTVDIHDMIMKQSPGPKGIILLSYHFKELFYEATGQWYEAYWSRMRGVKVPPPNVRDMPAILDDKEAGTETIAYEDLPTYNRIPKNRLEAMLRPGTRNALDTIERVKANIYKKNTDET